MKRQLLMMLMCLWVVSAWAIHPQEFESPEQEERYQELIEELRCLVCQNQNLADSNATLAKDLRDIVLEKMKEGMTDQEIKAFLLERYGEFVLYKPPVSSNTAVLWFGPAVFLLLGAVGLVVVLRKRATGGAAPDPEQEELDRRLEELEKENQ